MSASAEVFDPEDHGAVERDGQTIPVLIVNGVPRLLASYPALPGSYADLPAWSARNPVLPRKEWLETNVDDPNVAVINQGQTSSCTGCASVGALMRMRALAGLPTIALSPTYPYTFCNHGRDAGALISDVVKVLAKEGTCPIEYCPGDIVYANQVSPEARAHAVYRIADVYRATSFDDICSGLTLGWTCVYALQVGDRWSSPRCLDQDGCPPVYRGPGNHALHAAGLIFSKKRGWMPRGVNSWGEAWGVLGRFNASEQHFDMTAYQDAYLFRLAALAPDDPIGPTVPG